MQYCPLGCFLTWFFMFFCYTYDSFLCSPAISCLCFFPFWVEYLVCSPCSFSYNVRIIMEKYNMKAWCTNMMAKVQYSKFSFSFYAYSSTAWRLLRPGIMLAYNVVLFFTSFPGIQPFHSTLATNKFQ